MKETDPLKLPLELKLGEQWWNEFEEEEKEKERSRQPPPLPQIPRWFYGALAAAAVGSLCLMMSQAPPRPVARPASRTPDGPTDLAPAPTPHRRAGPSSPSGVPLTSIRPISRDLQADLTIEHIRSSVLTALKLGEKSEVLSLPPEELEIFRQWSMKARRLGDSLNLKLQKIGGGTTHSRHLQFRIALDGRRFIGVITLRRIDRRWTIVSAKLPEQDLLFGGDGN